MGVTPDELCTEALYDITTARCATKLAALSATLSNYNSSKN
jgi:hypothetical protein